MSSSADAIHSFYVERKKHKNLWFSMGSVLEKKNYERESLEMVLVDGLGVVTKRVGLGNCFGFLKISQN